MAVSCKTGDRNGNLLNMDTMNTIAEHVQIATHIVQNTLEKKVQELHG